MENLKNIKCSLVGLVQTQLGDLKHTDAKELGEVIDMIKDLEEAMYYCAIIEAMEESKKEKENSENSSFNNINYYMEPMYYQEGGQGSGSHGAGHGKEASGNRPCADGADRGHHLRSPQSGDHGLRPGPRGKEGSGKNRSDPRSDRPGGAE